MSARTALVHGTMASLLVASATVLPALAFAQQDASADAFDAEVAMDTASDALESADAEQEPTAATLGPETSLVISEGVNLRFSPPEGWMSVESKPVDIPDLDKIPGAQALFKHTWTAPHRRKAMAPRMSVVCATAPSDSWTRGLESRVFEHLTSVAHNELSEWTSVDSLQSGPIDSTSPLFFQSFEAKGRAGGQRKTGALRVLEEDAIDNKRAPFVGVGRHTLGFLANPDRVFVCSMACIEPAWRETAICPTSVASLHIDGALAPEPSSSTLGRLAIGIQRRPSALVGMAAGLLLAFVGTLAVLRGSLLRPASKS